MKPEQQILMAIENRVKKIIDDNFKGEVSTFCNKVNRASRGSIDLYDTLCNVLGKDLVKSCEAYANASQMLYDIDSLGINTMIPDSHDCLYKITYRDTAFKFKWHHARNINELMKQGKTIECVKAIKTNCLNSKVGLKEAKEIYDLRIFATPYE